MNVLRRSVHCGFGRARIRGIASEAASKSQSNLDKHFRGAECGQNGPKAPQYTCTLGSSPIRLGAVGPEKQDAEKQHLDTYKHIGQTVRKIPIRKLFAGVDVVVGH